MVRRAYAVVSSPANASATACGLPNWVIAAAAAWSGGSPVAMRSSRGLFQAVAQFGENRVAAAAWPA